MNERREQPHGHNRRRWSGCLVIFGAVLLVLAISWLLLGQLPDGDSEAFRAKGYPTTLQELGAWYPIPPKGENAAEYYIEAGRLLAQSRFPEIATLPDFGDRALPPLGSPLSEELLTTISAFLEHESEAFELIDEASQFEGSRYPLYSGVGTPMYNAFLGQVVMTRYRSSRGDIDVVLEQFARLVHLTRTRGREQRCANLAIFSSYVNITVDTAERIMNENNFSSEHLTELDRLLGQLHVESALVRCIVAERCSTLHIIDSNKSFSILHGHQRSGYIVFADAYLSIAERGLPDQLDQYRFLRTRKYSFLNRYSKMSATSFDAAVLGFYHVQAQVYAARAAIAVQRYRLDGGELPEDWDAMPITLKEVWPIDPFSGEPMRYKRTDEGFIVYSVSANFMDDGGDWEQNLDTVFRVLQ